MHNRCTSGVMAIVTVVFYESRRINKPSQIDNKVATKSNKYTVIPKLRVTYKN